MVDILLKNKVRWIQYSNLQMKLQIKHFSSIDKIPILNTRGINFLFERNSSKMNKSMLIYRSCTNFKIYVNKIPGSKIYVNDARKTLN